MTSQREADTQYIGKLQTSILHRSQNNTGRKFLHMLISGVIDNSLFGDPHLGTILQEAWPHQTF